MKAVEDLAMRFGLQQFGFEDHMFGVDATRWSTVAADSGATVARHTAAPFGGVVALTTGGTNNNEAYIFTAPHFAFAPGKPARTIGVLSVAEANTDDSAWFYGFMSGVAADTIVDGGLTFRASSYGAFIYKVKDSNFLRCGILNNGTLTGELTDIPSTGRKTLEIAIDPTAGNRYEVHFSIDRNGGQAPGPVWNRTYNYPILADADFGASPTALSLAAGIKAGGANSEVMLLDYASVGQRIGL